MSKIGTSFRNFRDRVRASVNVKARNFLFFTALALLVIVAIMIRLTPILRGPILIKAFDPWIQYYNAEYLSNHSLYDYFHWIDYKSWYPVGMNRSALRPGLPFTVLVIYQLLNFIGINISVYEVCFYFPAFMGGLTVLAAYFLGKELLDRKCGLLTAFFLAFNTGHMQRTMAGFFDNETIGVFATLMTFIFFLKAIRTGRITHSILGGIFLGYLSLSWGGYSYVFYLIPLICGLLVLMNKYNENVLIAYAGIQGTSLLIYALSSQFVHGELFSDLELGGPLIFTILLLIFHIIYTKKDEYPRFYNGLINSIKWALIPLLVTVAIIIWIDPNIIPLGLGKRFLSILSPLMRDQMHIIASVAEHMPSAWSIFYYNTLIPLMLLPLGIFFCFKKLEAPEILAMLFLLTLFYMTGSMIRIILLFAPAAALMGAYGIVNVLKIYGSFAGERPTSGVSRKRRRQLKRTVGNSEVFVVYFLVGFLCVSQVIHATEISVHQLSYSQIVAGGQFHDWEESLTWMKTNLPGDAVVVSWWDYGYWLTPIGNITTVNDNGTWNVSRIATTGMAMMQTNEIYSARVFRRLQADYVLVYFGFLINGLGGDEGKWPWMLRICNDKYSTFKRWGWEEDNWAEDSVFIESEYINGSSGKYEDKWFDSTIVKLMFHNEPTEYQSVANTEENQLRLHFALQLSGNPQTGTQAKEDDNGNTWKSHIPVDGVGLADYNFKVFNMDEGYFSRHHMVKLYKIDYTALESSFSIKNAKVFDNGYSIFNLKNLGTKDLTIKDVKINNVKYAFNMSKGGAEKKLETGIEDIVWVDLSSMAIPFKKDDVVNVTVTAEAEALKEKKYTFDNYTSNFFVTEAEEGAIRINRENSKIVQKGGGDVEVYLEVENIGNSVEKIDRFYENKDNDENFKFHENKTTYLSGSSILQPGEKAYVHIPYAPVPFDFIEWFANMIGVATGNELHDETLFSSNLEDYKISIINEDRIVSPEVYALTEELYPFRNVIPIKFNETFAYVHDNGNTTIKIDVKNTGDTVLGLDSVYLTGDLVSVDFDTIDHNLILDPNQENTIIMKFTPSDFNFEVNDDVGVTVTAIGFDGLTAASDVGVLQTVADKPDFQIIEEIANITSSYIMANESGQILIKNTGNENITLNKIYVNDTVALDVDYIYGDPSLDVQECAIMSFNINDTLLAINKSNNVVVKVNTTTNLLINKTFQALENAPRGPKFYDIEIDEGNTEISGTNLKIKVDNKGFRNVTIDSVYINDTYIPLESFTSSIGPPFEIGKIDGFIEINIDLVVLNSIVPFTVLDGDHLKILVRTKEGAEDEIEDKNT